jgi:hypothetical protein
MQLCHACTSCGIHAPCPAQAFATDSGDESPWIYYRWLLGNSLAHLRQAQDDAAAAACGGGSSGSTQDDRVQEATAVLGEVCGTSRHSLVKAVAAAF